MSRYKEQMSNYDELDTTAQRVYKYLLEKIKDKPQFISYTEIADEIGRTRSAVSYAVKKLLRAGKIAIQDDKIAVK